MGFENTVMYKRGQLGESIVDDLIQQKGLFSSYGTYTSGSHPFDRFFASKDKMTLMIGEIKTLDARDYYPDTGISIAHYNEYMYIQTKYNIDVFVIFVDPRLEMIYGNVLTILAEKGSIHIEPSNEIVSKWIDLTPSNRKNIIAYPIKHPNFTAAGKEIIYFPLTRMKKLCDLTESQCMGLKKYSNKEYKQDISWKSGYKEWKKKKEQRHGN